VTAGLDERRPDHTRPTIAFIALAVVAAAVMTAGMTGNRPDTPIAADRPPRVVPEVASPSPQPPATPDPTAFPEFSMADVVTLATAEAATERPRPRRPRASGAGGSAGSTDDGTSTAGGGSGDTGPGRSETGQGKARGQQDATPGRAGGGKRADRPRGRR
jgi:hypothetical protein